MDISEEIYITSRSKTPSIIDIKSQSEKVFAQLPDLIQEAIVSTECENTVISYISLADHNLSLKSAFENWPCTEWGDRHRVCNRHRI
jgi:hypothetical protein